MHPWHVVRFRADRGNKCVNWCSAVLLQPLSEAGNVPEAVDYLDLSMDDCKAKVAAACKTSGKAWGLPVGDAAGAQSMYEMGAQFVNLGGDFGAIMHALEEGATSLNSAADAAKGGAD
jgi:hypothetical protein